MHTGQIKSLYRIIIFVILFTPGAAVAFFGSGTPLVTINGVEYSKQDYEKWWGFWKDEGSVLPASPDSYIDWLLMQQQAREMELFKNPSYQAKVNVFLKVRGLMYLKNEEIDRKMKLGDAEIRQYYQEKYLPIFNVQVLFFDELAKAQNVYEELDAFDGQEAGRLIFADQKGVSSDAGGPTYYRESVVRPVSFAKSGEALTWIKELKSLKKDQISEPFKVENNFVLARLVKREMPAPDDYEKFKSKARTRLFKMNRGRLTKDLISKLRVKYKVVVQGDLINGLSLNKAYTKEEFDEVVLQIGKMSITAGYLLDRVKKQNAWRKKNGQMDLSLQKSLWRVVNGMITQTLIDWEALDRHYERKEPLKSLYDFYTGNRLVEELKASIRSSVKVTDDEIAEYYREHKQDYTQPPMTVFARFIEEEKLINKIWAGVIQGKEFDDLIRSYYSRKLEIINKKDSDIVPQVMTVLSSLAKGEVSAPFDLDGRFAMVKLISRNQVKVKPLKQVRGEIRTLLTKNKQQKSRDEYLQRLKEKSKISVNVNIWKKIQKDLGESTNAN